MGGVAQLGVHAGRLYALSFWAGDTLGSRAIRIFTRQIF